MPGSGAPEKLKALLSMKRPAWATRAFRKKLDKGKRGKEASGMSTMPYYRIGTPVPRAGPRFTVQAFHPGCSYSPATRTTRKRLPCRPLFGTSVGTGWGSQRLPNYWASQSSSSPSPRLSPSRLIRIAKAQWRAWNKRLGNPQALSTPHPGASG